MKGPLCAHQCCPIGVGAHSGAHFCTDTHGGGALGDALGDRVMTLALWRAISQQEQPDLVLFCSWQRSWQGAGGLERCRCHGCWGFSHARTALSRERAPPAKRTRPASSTPVTASMHVELLVCFRLLRRQPFRPPLLRRLPSSRGPQRSVEDVHPTTHPRGWAVRPFPAA